MREIVYESTSTIALALSEAVAVTNPGPTTPAGMRITQEELDAFVTPPAERNPATKIVVLVVGVAFGIVGAAFAAAAHLSKVRASNEVRRACSQLGVLPATGRAEVSGALNCTRKVGGDMHLLLFFASVLLPSTGRLVIPLRSRHVPFGKQMQATY